MSVLDCGCGEATITLGLAEAVLKGRVVGVDVEKDSFAAARCHAASNLSGRINMQFIAAFSTVSGNSYGIWMGMKKPLLGK